ncbi:MAG: extracellular solute-binding protein [Candidatus Wallacebacter cryptica]
MRKAVVCLVLALSLLFSLSGFVVAQDDVVELWYMGWAWPGDQPQEPRLDAFMEMYPNIIVTYEYVESGQFNDRITALAAAGTLPDVLWIMDNNMYVYNQWVADITDFLENDPTFDPDLFWGNSLEPMQFKDCYFGLPFQLQASFLVANLDVLNYFGMRLPDPSWTWDDLWAFCQRMNRPAQNYYGMEDPWMFWAFMPPAYLDGTTWDALRVDGTRLMMDDPNVIEALKTAIRWERENAAVSIGLADGSILTPWDHPAFVDAYGNVSPWMQNKAAFHVGWSWSFSWWTENYESEWDIIPYPHGPARQATPLIVDHMGISPTTKHPEEAFTFLRWMSYDQDGWAARMQAEVPVPYSMPTIDAPEAWDLYFGNENVPAGMRNVYATLEGGVVDPNRYVPELGYVWDNFITPARDQLRLGAAAFEDVMPAAVEQANKYLEEAWAANNAKLDAALGK